MSGTVSIRNRFSQTEALGNHIFDVLVLGGGITGVATAHELTSRGYRTALIDSHDFASGTSQESSQLIWGGIKYLEQGRVRLVSGLCNARNEWIQHYPDRVMKQRFLYPRYEHDRHSMPLLLAGAWAYWVMGSAFGWPPMYRQGGSLERMIPTLQMDELWSGMEYTDARMIRSDARLVLDVLFDTIDAGLTAVNYVEFRGTRPAGRRGEIEVEGFDTHEERSIDIRCRWIVNTTGVWVDEVNRLLGVEAPHALCFSKGIHLVVPRIETGERALTCMANDGRVFFVIPWGKVTLIGTTDTRHDAAPGRVKASATDIDYLRTECEAKFRMKLEDKDVLNTKAGLRPLVRPKRMKQKDFLELSREHKVWSDPSARISALWGGKYTDAFPMAREIADTVAVNPSQDSGQIVTRPALPFPDAQSYPSGTIDVSALRDACSREMVVKLEDLIRRRTNIGLKVARGGWGRENEHETSMERIAAVIGEITGRSTETVLGDYKSLQD